jgi:hypothetical protein
VRKILSINAFDADRAGALEPGLRDLVARRQRAFGAHALLSYANPVEFVREKACGSSIRGAPPTWTSTTTCHPSGIAIRTWSRQFPGRLRF